jgi:hypothetical protein
MATLASGHLLSRATFCFQDVCGCGGYGRFSNESFANITRLPCFVRGATDLLSTGQCAAPLFTNKTV